jgi:uncharacterized protein YkwD
MVRKTLVFMVLLGLILSGCGGGTPVPTEAPVTEPPVAPTKIEPPSPPTAESSPTPSITETPLATNTIPPNLLTCINSATFVADISVPDHMQMGQGQAFTKIWSIRNTGTCIWTSQYSLVFQSGEQMGAPVSIPLDNTTPGETFDVSVDMVSPSKSGTFRADFELHDLIGRPFDIDGHPSVWVIVDVGNVTAVPIGTISNNSNGYATVYCEFTLSDERVASVLEAINTYRANNNLTPYAINDQLQEAAQAHANDIACHGLFGHTGSNQSTPQTRVAFSGYKAASLSENVYGSYPALTGHSVVSWWATDRDDLTHNLNLLSTQYTEVGIGYAFYKNFGYYVVVFAAPKK